MPRRPERFLHDDTLPPLVHAGLAHAQFEAIHPFLDGNGRVGRLLITLLLVEREILPSPLLYLSAYFESSREDYYAHLLAVTQEGAWERWLAYFLRGVQSRPRTRSTAWKKSMVCSRNGGKRLLVFNPGGRKRCCVCSSETPFGPWAGSPKNWVSHIRRPDGPSNDWNRRASSRRPGRRSAIASIVRAKCLRCWRPLTRQDGLS